MKNPFSAALWWLRYRFQPSHRYHFVATGLPPGYADSDERMAGACFTTLEQFIERERPVEWWCGGRDPREDDNCPHRADCASRITDFRMFSAHHHELADLLDIYDWWKWRKDYDPWDFIDFRDEPDTHQPINADGSHADVLYTSARSRACGDESDALDEWTDQQLARLVALRRHMWT